MSTVLVMILISGSIFTIFQTQIQAQIESLFLEQAYAQQSHQYSSIACPAKNVQHWDKIVFVIKSADLSKRLKLPAISELDIKVLDDPTKVADLKKNVLNFLKVPNEPRSSIEIRNVEYSIICTGNITTASSSSSSSSSTNIITTLRPPSVDCNNSQYRAIHPTECNRPPSLIVHKTVNCNNNSPCRSANDFVFDIRCTTQQGATTFTTSTRAGVLVTVPIGSICTVTERPLSGFSGTVFHNPDGCVNVVIQTGQRVTCNVTNTYNPPIQPSQSPILVVQKTFNNCPAGSTSCDITAFDFNIICTNQQNLTTLMRTVSAGISIPVPAGDQCTGNRTSTVRIYPSIRQRMHRCFHTSHGTGYV